VVIEARWLAEGLGMELVRTASLNDEPSLMAGLAELVTATNLG
jgi:protoheme ferro-lyase